MDVRKRSKLALRFSLRSLLLSALLASSAWALFWHWAPWALEREFPANAIAFSKDGTRIAVGVSGLSLQIYNGNWAGNTVLDSGQAVSWQIEFSADGKLLAVCGDIRFGVWDASTGKLKFSCAEPYPVVSARFSRDGTQLLTCDCKEYTKIWSTADGHALEEIAYDQAAFGSVFTPNEDTVAVYSESGLAYWNRSTKKIKLIDSTGPDVNFQWTVNESTQLEDVFTGWHSVPLRGFVRDWHKQKLTAANEHGLGSIEPDGSVCLWNTLTGAREVVLPAGQIRYKTLVLSPDLHRLAVIDEKFIGHLYAYRRPNTPWGIILLPELWLTVLAGVGLLWSLWRDRRVLTHRTSSNH